MRIEDFDKNFKIKSVNKDDIKIYNPEEAPFVFYGTKRYGDKLLRIPEEIAKSTNESVEFLNGNTAGARIRFKTNSNYIAIFLKYSSMSKMGHMTMTGSCGADLYVTYNNKQMYVNSYCVPFETVDKYENVIDVDFNGEMMEYTINLPLYASVTDVYIGLNENAIVEKPSSYVNELPIVFYGSSITQGGCASRPGNSYQAILSRRFNIDYTNLGFSGGAKGEDAIVNYIAELPMSLFVLDYDHNAPTSTHLEATHEKVFKKIREKHPDVPIVILSAPCFDKETFPNKWFYDREAIVEKTYNNAIKNGDKNVYYINGKTLMKDCGYEGTVDNCHPNDLGFYSMANAIGDVFEKIFSKYSL